MMLRGHAAPGGLLRVLFLQQDPGELEASETILREFGFRLQDSICRTKEEFHEQILSRTFDVVVGTCDGSDWRGAEALRWMRSSGIPYPYILIADRLDAVATKECLQAGASGFVAKSDLAQLPATIERALHEHELMIDRDDAIAELVQSEEKFSKTFRLSPVACAIATLRETKFVDVNDAFMKMTGYTLEELVGSSGDQLGLWLDPKQPAAMNQQLKWGNPVKGMETEIRTKTGEIRVIKVAAEVIQLGGEPCILALADDLTEAKQLQQQFLQAQKMEAIGLLSGGVAHDFNNLLGVILGNVELANELLEEGSPVKTRLAQIQMAVDDGVGLCRQLMSFSRKQASEPSVFDLNTLVEDLQMMLKRLIGENIALTIEVPETPCYIRADRGLVNQAIVNLIVNSRDALPVGGKIAIKVRQTDVNSGFEEIDDASSNYTHVMLAVSDTGHGMDENTLGEIFKPFFTTKTDGKGTGLGLVMVRGFVTQSGGMIKVESKPNAGTTFKMYLPAIRNEQEAAGIDCAIEEPIHGNEEVLVVEDNPALLEVTAMQLRNAGYSVLEARDSEEATSLLQSHGERIRLIVTDVILPTESGPGFLRELRGSNSAVKVLYLSGYPRTLLGQYIESNDDLPLLLKPFTKNSLLTRVRATLDATPSRGLS